MVSMADVMRYFVRRSSFAFSFSLSGAFSFSREIGAPVSTTFPVTYSSSVLDGLLGTMVSFSKTFSRIGKTELVSSGRIIEEFSEAARRGKS